MCDDKYGSPLKPPISTFELNTDGLSLNEQIGTLTPNGSFSMGMIQKVGTSFNHVGGFQ